MRRILLAVLVLAGAVAALAWVLIVSGSGKTIEACCGFGPTRLTYEHGATHEVTVQVRNAGRVPVEIVEVPVESASSFNALFAFTGARVGARGDLNVPPETSAPFHAFELEPDEVRGLVLVGRFGDCDSYDEGTIFTIYSKRLRFRVLGVARDVMLTLPTPLAVRSPPDEACPTR